MRISHVLRPPTIGFDQNLFIFSNPIHHRHDAILISFREAFQTSLSKGAQTDAKDLCFGYQCFIA
jgi:hypothetical protein